MSNHRMPAFRYHPAVIIIVTLLLVPVSASAQLSQLTPFAGTSTGTLVESITSIVNALLGLAALIAAIALVFSTVTALSGRDEEDIARRAKLTIVYILLGLIVIGLSAIIINFFIRAIP